MRNYRIDTTMLIVLLLGLLASSSAWAADLLKVSVIDVGQGDSIFIQFPNGQDMLVDTADSAHGKDVVSYLHSLMISKVDILVATHPHADRIGGMADVLGAFTIGKVSGQTKCIFTRAQSYFNHIDIG